jgi:hypothetical protein
VETGSSGTRKDDGLMSTEADLDAVVKFQDQLYERWMRGSRDRVPGIVIELWRYLCNWKKELICSSEHSSSFVCVPDDRSYGFK